MKLDRCFSGTAHIFQPAPCNTIAEVIKMDKEKREKGRQKKSQDKFNNITNSVKPEHQNQTHNVRKEGVGPQNNKY
jgi:hypothetical protein